MREKKCDDDDIAPCCSIILERRYIVGGDGRLSIFTPKNTVLSKKFPKVVLCQKERRRELVE